MRMFRFGIFIALLLVAGLMWFVTSFCEDDWCFIFPWQKKSILQDAVSSEFVSEKVRVSAPQINALVRSPLEISGSARGTWFFEASFPVALLDGNGKEIARSSVEAQGEWMTSEFVPFRAELKFATPKTEKGTLVLEKDNPSGLPQNDEKVSFPVRFR